MNPRQTAAALLLTLAALMASACNLAMTDGHYVIPPQEEGIRFLYSVSMPSPYGNDGSGPEMSIPLGDAVLVQAPGAVQGYVHLDVYSGDASMQAPRSFLHITGTALSIETLNGFSVSSNTMLNDGNAGFITYGRRDSETDRQLYRITTSTTNATELLAAPFATVPTLPAMVSLGNLAGMAWDFSDTLRSGRFLALFNQDTNLAVGLYAEPLVNAAPVGSETGFTDAVKTAASAFPSAGSDAFFNATQINYRQTGYSADENFAWFVAYRKNILLQTESQYLFTLDLAAAAMSATGLSVRDVRGTAGKYILACTDDGENGRIFRHTFDLYDKNLALADSFSICGSTVVYLGDKKLDGEPVGSMLFAVVDLDRKTMLGAGSGDTQQYLYVSVFARNIP